MGICHITIAVILAKNEDQWPTHEAAGWAAIAMVWLFVAHFVSYPGQNMSVCANMTNRDGRGDLGRFMAEYETNAYTNLRQRLDPSRRGLAAISSSPWHRARSVLQLDEREWPHFSPVDVALFEGIWTV